MTKPFPSLAKIHTVVFDFDGVFTDNKVWVHQDGGECVRCDRADGFALDMMRFFQKKNKLKIEFFILSKESNPVVLARAKKLKLECRQAVGDKLTFIREYLISRFPECPDIMAGVVYLGNDLNDLPLMCEAGYSVAPADAHPQIMKVADLVLRQKGGEGFVRAFIERLLGINKLSKEKLNELISHC